METIFAANDDAFHVPKVRNAPIKSSMTCVANLPKTLKIYRIAGSKYWQVRLYARGRYLSQSLKTTDVDQAKDLAKVFFEDASADLPPLAVPVN